MDFWAEILSVAESITTDVGQTLLREFGQAQAVTKADGTLVTQADQWSDRTIREKIQQAFPQHGLLSEEMEHIFPDSEWCWIIDPIDGTTNFARGIPLWAISLGLLYRGTPVFGHVFVPTLSQSFHGFWYGESGLTGPTGAYLNHQPIRVSSAEPSGNQLFNFCARSTPALRRSDPFPCKLRLLGAASYNLLTVAMGAALGGVEATPKIWDIAAVWAIVQAAGGTWHSLSAAPMFPLQPGQDYSQRSYPTLVVSQPELLALFLPWVQFLGESG
jgi:myo-inositol-1(or 4)-monophosphatase